MQKVKVHKPAHKEKEKLLLEIMGGLRNVIMKAWVFTYDLIGAKRYEEERTNQTRDITGLRLTLGHLGHRPLPNWILTRTRGREMENLYYDAV